MSDADPQLALLKVQIANQQREIDRLQAFVDVVTCEARNDVATLSIALMSHMEGIEYDDFSASVNEALHRPLPPRERPFVVTMVYRVELTTTIPATDEQAAVDAAGRVEFTDVTGRYRWTVEEADRLTATAQEAP